MTECSVPGGRIILGGRGNDQPADLVAGGGEDGAVAQVLGHVELVGLVVPGDEILRGDEGVVVAGEGVAVEVPAAVAMEEAGAFDLLVGTDP